MENKNIEINKVNEDNIESTKDNVEAIKDKYSSEALLALFIRDSLKRKESNK